MVVSSPSRWETILRIVRMFLVFAVCELCVCAQTEFSANRDGYRNLWLSPDQKTILAIEIYGTAIHGRIVGMYPNYGRSGALLLDSRNESPEMNTRQICGMKIFRNLHWDAKDRAWKGHTYSPQTGKHYSVQIALEKAGQLLVSTNREGYGVLGLNWFSQKTEVWTAYKGKISEDCTIHIK